MADARWHLVVVLGILLMLGATAFAVWPNTARGSQEHSSPILTLVQGCPQDDERTLEIKHRCEHEGRVRLALGTAGVLLGAIVAAAGSFGVLRVSLRSRSPRSVTSS